MNSDDFESLLAYSQPFSSDGSTISFEPYKGFEYAVSELIKKNNLENISIKEFIELNQKYSPLIQAKEKLREKRVSEFVNMTTENIAKLPLERKVDYLEAVFHKRQTLDELNDMCSKHKYKLKALLFNIQFPKDFWHTEEKSADRFIALVANNPKITDNMKNWHNLSPDDKRETIFETAKIIEYTYGSPLEIGFYTSEEYRKQNNLDDNAHVNGAYQENGKIFFNTDRLNGSDNYMGVSVVFHEFMHKRQHEIDFGNPLINKLFSNKMGRAESYEKYNIEPETPEYGDFYSLNPSEVHAFTMQKYVEDKIADKTGIEKTHAQVTKTTQKMHDKSFVMATISRHRSAQ